MHGRVISWQHHSFMHVHETEMIEGAPEVECLTQRRRGAKTVNEFTGHDEAGPPSSGLGEADRGRTKRLQERWSVDLPDLAQQSAAQMIIILHPKVASGIYDSTY